MYTFSALESIPVSHEGFWIIAGFVAIVLVISLFDDPDLFFAIFFFTCFPVGISYGVSYHWTDQTPKTFANTPVIAEFQGYAPEGYSERSGKHMVDRHFVYVVYTVDGNPVLLRADTGQAYPKTTTLFKN